MKQEKKIVNDLIVEKCPHCGKWIKMEITKVNKWSDKK